MSKLVRDRIPELIRAKGEAPVTRVLDGEEYVRALRAKLEEEVREYLQDRTAEELADVLEVLRALAALHGLTPEELEDMRARKAKERGGLAGRVWLEGVLEDAGKTNAR